MVERRTCAPRPYFHNQIGILTETAHRYAYALATTNPIRCPKTIGNGIATDGTAINYPDPWRGGESHFRDAVDYMLTAAMATLSIGARPARRSGYTVCTAWGRDAIERGKTT